MSGGVIVAEVGSQHGADLAIFIKDARMIERWVRDASPGDLLFYARIEHLPPRSTAAEMVRKLADDLKVTMCQRRRPDGTVDYWIRRKAKVRATPPQRALSTAPRLSAEAKIVERYLRQVARAGGVCPHYATIARINGLRDADRARYAERQLRKAGILSSEILDQASGLRVVTFTDGLSTARPNAS